MLASKIMGIFFWIFFTLKHLYSLFFPLPSLIVLKTSNIFILSHICNVLWSIPLIILLIFLCLLLTCFSQQVPFLPFLCVSAPLHLFGLLAWATVDEKLFIWARVTYQCLHHSGTWFPFPATLNCLLGPSEMGCWWPSLLRVLCASTCAWPLLPASSP